MKDPADGGNKKEPSGNEEPQPKSSRTTNEMTQFIGPFTVDVSNQTVEGLTEEIDKFITEKKSHIKGDYPEGIILHYKQKELRKLQKLRNLQDYRDLTMVAVEKEPSAQDGQEEQLNPDKLDKPKDDFDD